MRPSLLAIPATLALLTGGGALLIAAQRPHVSGETGLLEAEVRHKVTPDMVQETSAEAKKVAPAFQVKDVDGKEISIASPNAERPQFVYFVLDGCPCSFDAEPLFHELYKLHKGEVDFISVTNGDAKKARRWSDQMLVPYPVIPDPKLEIIHDFHARSSVYSALVTKDGRIEKMWPGYSKEILQEENEAMAKVTGRKAELFDPQYAPTEKATGCAFDPKL